MEPFVVRGRVEAVLVNSVFGQTTSTSVGKIKVFRGQGVKGDNHASHNGARLLDAREKEMTSFGFLKGIEIANHREFSAVSVEELTEIKSALKLPSLISFGTLGENLVISGIPKLTKLPPSTLLFFHDANKIRTAVLAVWAENMPCIVAGESLQKSFPDVPKLASLFPKASIGKRGVVGSVYSSGNIHEGDEVVAHIPRQKHYGLDV